MAAIKKITIPTIKQELITVTIEGITPLLMNRFPPKRIQDIIDGQTGVAQGNREHRKPEEEYLDSIHRLEDGRPGFPASGVKKAAVAGCRFISSVPMTQARGAFFVMPEPGEISLIPIEGDHQMHTAMVRLPNGVMTPCWRAVFPEWTSTFDVQYSSKVISPESVVNLINHGGFYIGLGDDRPGKTGNTYGMFKVKAGD